MNEDPVAASSKTYRVVVNKLAKVARVTPKHTSYPSADFETMTDILGKKSQDRALHYYERGLRRGFIEACDALIDGQLEFKNGTLYCQNKVAISRKFRFRDQAPQSRTFRFKAEDLGFK
jgi:hypothetical protein